MKITARPPIQTLIEKTLARFAVRFKNSAGSEISRPSEKRREWKRRIRQPDYREHADRPARQCSEYTKLGGFVFVPLGISGDIH